MMLPGERTGPARIGVTVFLTLMALTIIEYVVSRVLTRNLPVMIVMNIIDAGLIVYFFMHVVRLWRGKEAS